MLKLGMILLGSALVLHGRNKASGKDDDKNANPDDDSSANPGGFAPKPYEPVLDSALGPNNPFVIGTSGGDGNPNTAPTYPTIGNPWGGPIGPIVNVGTTDDANAAAITANQLSAANNAYGRLVGLIPDAARFHISTIKRLASWHKRVFHF